MGQAAQPQRKPQRKPQRNSVAGQPRRKSEEHNRRATVIKKGPQTGKARAGSTVNEGVHYDETPDHADQILRGKATAAGISQLGADHNEKKQKKQLVKGTYQFTPTPQQEEKENNNPSQKAPPQKPQLQHDQLRLVRGSVTKISAGQMSVRLPDQTILQIESDGTEVSTGDLIEFAINNQGQRVGAIKIISAGNNNNNDKKTYQMPKSKKQLKEFTGNKTKNFADYAEQNKSKNFADYVERNKSKSFADHVKENKTKNFADYVEENRTRNFADYFKKNEKPKE